MIGIHRRCTSWSRFDPAFACRHTTPHQMFSSSAAIIMTPWKKPSVQEDGEQSPHLLYIEKRPDGATPKPLRTPSQLYSRILFSRQVSECLHGLLLHRTVELPTRLINVEIRLMRPIILPVLPLPLRRFRGVAPPAELKDNFARPEVVAECGSTASHPPARSPSSSSSSSSVPSRSLVEIGLFSLNFPSGVTQAASSSSGPKTAGLI